MTLATRSMTGAERLLAACRLQPADATPVWFMRQAGRSLANYRKLREPAVIYPVVCVVLLMLVGTFFLDKSHATHRWIKLGPANIQPSELAKLAVILYLAWFLDLKRRGKAGMEFCKEDFLETLLPAAGPILICVALVLLQPDLGTALTYIPIALMGLFLGGVRLKQALIVLVMAGLIMPLASIVLKALKPSDKK